MSLQALILAGGQSSRMGSRKELLRFTDNSSALYLHLARAMKIACPELDLIHLSLKDLSARSNILQASRKQAENAHVHVHVYSGQLFNNHPNTDSSRDGGADVISHPSSDCDNCDDEDGKGININIRFLYDEPVVENTLPTSSHPAPQTVGNDRKRKPYYGIGPAAGLLAAHNTDPSATWLVVACDFPLLTPRTVRCLQEQHYSNNIGNTSSRQPLLTCYHNAHGHYEPLLAIWTPEALRMLDGNVKQGRTGPRFVIEELRSKGPGALRVLVPQEELWLFNANTIEEWREAVRLFEKGKERRGAGEENVRRN
ncbi:hypothetical protein EMCG_06426 [[Emmonsia] crescens]|uniref:MobA-like NTP transferase domain-containing protein n=1 Tax=[Emmonsia] crescens TaxID=73230 RepID=A0A0G2IB67_9EURO|nr:hypothetical protein EMCG_06426 [Emmonsia crescens UAMH 3008]